MDQSHNKIETKTHPFAVSKSTVNSLQTKNVKKMKFSTGREPNYFYITVGVFIIFATGVIVYVLISLSQLEKLSQVNSIVNNTTTVVEVSDTENTPLQNSWVPKELKINNNIVWNLQLPESFVETTVGATDGTNVFTGLDGGNQYKLLLTFPLFTNYPGGEPESLKLWIEKELSFLTPEESLTIRSESFTLENNIAATLLINMREITADSGNARIFGSKKSLVLYISKTKNRNFSKITLVPEGTYSEQTAKSVMERIASSIKF